MKEKILIIEDDPTIQAQLKNLLAGCPEQRHQNQDTDYSCPLHFLIINFFDKYNH